MAGTITDSATFWNVGDTAGRNEYGQATTLPVSAVFVGNGTPTPTAAPAGAPLYIDTDTDDLFVWMGTAWKGPYSLASNFAVSTHTHA
jgi:hypothetical protein